MTTLFPEERERGNREGKNSHRAEKNRIIVKKTKERPLHSNKIKKRKHDQIIVEITRCFLNYLFELL